MDLLKPIANLKIDNGKKVHAMRTLVNDKVLSEADVIKFLINHDLRSILEIFLSSDHISKRKTIPVSPGSGWTSTELDYYNIVFEDVSPDSIVNTNASLSDKALRFIDSNKDFALSTLADKIGIEQQQNFRDASF